VSCLRVSEPRIAMAHPSWINYKYNK
jgi:hypothetical protein